MSEPVDDVYALAKAQFDLKEFLRAAHTLRVRWALARGAKRAALTATRCFTRRPRPGAKRASCAAMRCTSRVRSAKRKSWWRSPARWCAPRPGAAVPHLFYAVPCSQGRSNDVLNQELPQLEAELAPLFDQASTGAARVCASRSDAAHARCRDCCAPLRRMFTALCLPSGNAKLRLALLLRLLRTSTRATGARGWRCRTCVLMQQPPLV